MEINFILCLALYVYIGIVYVLNYTWYDKFYIHWFCTGNGFWNN